MSIQFDPVQNFMVADTVIGKLILNRHGHTGIEFVLTTGWPHVIHEIAHLCSLIDMCEEGAVAVDVGANVGMMTLPMARALRLKGGHIVAFEPQRILHQALGGTMALNGVENAYLFNWAVGKENGSVRINMPNYSDKTDFGRLSFLTFDPGLRYEDVDLITIDSLNLQRLDILKIDAEGMDIDVLTGARATLVRCRPWCYVEHLGLQPEDIRATFDGLEYEFFYLDGLNMLCAPSERLAAVEFVPPLSTDESLRYALDTDPLPIAHRRVAVEV